MTAAMLSAMPNRLRELRMERAKLAPTAYTVAALARRIGVAESVYWRWENGVHIPNKRHARALAREFDVNVDGLHLTSEDATHER